MASTIRNMAAVTIYFVAYYLKNMATKVTI